MDYRRGNKGVHEMREFEDFIPKIDVVDIAYQIIALHEENKHLRSELEHYKEIAQMGHDSMSASIKHSEEMIGLVLKAAIDPESNLNKMLKVK
jgi:hypothetical protein